MERFDNIFFCILFNSGSDLKKEVTVSKEPNQQEIKGK